MTIKPFGSTGVSTGSTSETSLAADIFAAVLTFAFAGAILTGVVLLFLPTLPGLLWVMLAKLPALGGLSSPVLHLLIDLLLGAAAGVIIGVIRWRRRNRSEVAEELVAAIGSPDVLDVARIGWSSALVHAAAGLAAGLAVALVGAHLAGALGGQIAVPGSAAGAAVQLVGGGGGAGAGGLESILSFLLSLLIVIVILGALFGAAAASGVAAIAGSTLSGTIHGLGQGLGTALMLALTRLWTSELTQEARIARGLAPLTLPGAVDAYMGQTNATPRHLVGRYFDWLVANGHPLDPRSVVDAFPLWARFLRERGRGNPPHEVDRFVSRVRSEMARRAPEKRLTISTGAPALDGTRQTLLYPGWLRRSLLTGAAIGGAAGALQALLVSAALLLLGK